MRLQNKLRDVLLLSAGWLIAGALNAQTIFSNPVGINVSSVSGTNKLDVDGDIRFRTLPTTLTGTKTLVTDASGNITFSTHNHLFSATASGKFLMSDLGPGYDWIQSPIIEASGSTHEVLKVGDGFAAMTGGLARMGVFGGNLALTAPGDPTTWSGSGLTELYSLGRFSQVPHMSSLRLFSGYWGTWLGIDKTLSTPVSSVNFFTDETAPGGVRGRLGFNYVKYNSGTHTVIELMSLISAGNLGIGTDDPTHRLQLNNASNTDVYSQWTNGATGLGYTRGFIVGIDNTMDANINNREEANMNFLTLDTKRMTIDLSGVISMYWDVPNPSRYTVLNLDQHGSSHAMYMNFTNQTTGSSNVQGLRLGIDNDENAVINQQENKDMIFYTNGSNTATANNNERMRITAAGDVGIGTSSPTAKLTVEGHIYPALDRTYNIGTTFGISGTDWRWDNICAWNSTIQTSDRNHKTSIKDLTYGISDIMKLRPVSYVWKEKANGTRLGLIAQEVQPIINEVVVGEDGKGMGMRYAELIPVLIKGIQEQQLMIEEQKKQLSQMQEKLAALSAAGNTTQKAGAGEGQPKQTLVLNDQPQLLQNEPNPFNGNTLIRYYIPAGTTNAVLKIIDGNGKMLSSYKLSNTGYSYVNVEAGSIAQGTYTYTLMLGEKVVDSKKMIIVRD